MSILDPIGWLDVLSGALLYFTVSPIPIVLAESHAFFLLIKGTGTLIKPSIFPLPVFILGSGADIISASIILVGQPPVLAEYKLLISGILFLKGAWGLFGFMS